MSIEIERLLDRRSDLSTFVVHLTKNGDLSAAENLAAILSSHTIEARQAMGWLGTGSKRIAGADLDAMKVVCFSETPLEHAYSLFQEIKGRKVKLSTYGIAFTKAVARQKGVNPVWYVDMTMGRDWELAAALDALREDAKASAGGFASHHGATILPFVEQMGSWHTTQKEFSWEREWRHRGDFRFEDFDVALVLCPEAEIGEFEALGPYAAVDPSWSLERIIDSLTRSRAVLSWEVSRIAARKELRGGR